MTSSLVLAIRRWKAEENIVEEFPSADALLKRAEEVEDYIVLEHSYD